VTLLTTDRNGEPVSLDELISDGLEGGYEDRLPGLRELCVGGDAQACQVLVAWSDPVGLATLTRWAQDGADIDFAPLVDAIRIGKYTATDDTDRIVAVRALLGLADREPIGEALNDAIPGDDAFITAVADALRGAIERSLDRGGAALTEAAALVVPLARVDDDGAAALAARLRKRDKRNKRLLAHLAAAMGQGRGPATLAVLEDLRTDKRVRETADAVYAHRRRR
jgi:hypothetical protein